MAKRKQKMAASLKYVRAEMEANKRKFEERRRRQEAEEQRRFEKRAAEALKTVAAVEGLRMFGEPESVSAVVAAMRWAQSK